MPLRFICGREAFDAEDSEPTSLGVWLGRLSGGGGILSAVELGDSGVLDAPPRLPLRLRPAGDEVGAPSAVLLPGISSCRQHIGARELLRWLRCAACARVRHAIVPTHTTTRDMIGLDLPNAWERP